MAKSFPLEANRKVSLHMSGTSQPVPHVFYEIPPIKRQHQQLPLLPDMNFFVIDQPGIPLILGVAQQHERIQRNSPGKIKSDIPDHARCADNDHGRRYSVSTDEKSCVLLSR